MLLKRQTIRIVELPTELFFRQLLDLIVDLGQLTALLFDPLCFVLDQLGDRLRIVDRHDRFEERRLAKRIDDFLRIGFGQLEIGVVADVRGIHCQREGFHVLATFVGRATQGMRLERKRKNAVATQPGLFGPSSRVELGSRGEHQLPPCRT